MNISYSWLKEYIDFDLDPDQLAAKLTQLGLEAGSVEEVETVKGGLKGLVIGEVKTCIPHPNSDHLSKTTVDIGTGDLLPIVCGAPNVAAGQKVVVATVGTVLYDGDQEFVIKRSKIRGEESLGMLCAEDEIGLGTNHQGIMVLPNTAKTGTPASEYFNVKSDYLLEVDLTPNRIDAGSHIGVARDIAAELSLEKPTHYKMPSIEAFKINNTKRTIPVEIENKEACQRYTALTISGITIRESPEWLQNRLRTIGLKPINNVVDVTNFILAETGQPLHSFDADEIKGNKVIVKTLPQGTKFTTLDGIERELDHDDLMICNTQEPMCMAGVFGGTKSGIKDSTTNVFLESAWFNPVYVRKTSRRHGLHTDAAFHFERGVDPNNLIYSLKRAALLIQETAGGEISSEIIDVCTNPKLTEYFPVSISYAHTDKLIGKALPHDLIKSILNSLEIRIVRETSEGLDLEVPPYRVDVTREADVIEDILRVYGYNRIIPNMKVNSTIQYSAQPDRRKLQNLISERLTGLGFNEIMNNSLTKQAYYESLKSYQAEHCIKIMNPLSSDLNVMRQSLLFGGLETIERNSKFKNANLKLYEFGNVYYYKGLKDLANHSDNYYEEAHLSILITGDKEATNWTTKEQTTSFFDLKSTINNILNFIGIKESQIKCSSVESDLFSDGLLYSTKNEKTIAEIGIVNSTILKGFDISNPVYYANLQWDNILNASQKNTVLYKELPKYPEVRRDLALLLDQTVNFNQVKEVAVKTEHKFLRYVDLFDVYEGEKLPKGKKSYAVSFTLRDDERTLEERQIEKIMQRLIQSYERELNAQIR